MSLSEGLAALLLNNLNKAENIFHVTAFDSSASVQEKEQAVLQLAKLYATNNEPEKIKALVPAARDLFSKIAKAKVGKVLKDVIDLYSAISNYSEEVQKYEKELIDELIEWAIAEKKSFLRQQLQLKLAGVYYKRKAYKDCLAIVADLLREFKKLDDKLSLIEVQLLEARVQFDLRNYVKLKASLTSAKTSANLVYTSTRVQAELDLMLGVLHCEDRDYDTAYSYFYEAFECYNNADDFDNAVKLLKYMVLTKIMLDKPDELKQLLGSKAITNNIMKHEKYKASEFEPMRLILESYEHKSLSEFQQALLKYNNELSQDVIIKSHFKLLYNNLMEQNLLKIIQPYSVVEVLYVAQQIKLDFKIVENKLSQMILDGVFYGVLDQGNGWLYVYDKPQKDENYSCGLELVKEMNEVVELLYEKGVQLN